MPIGYILDIEGCLYAPCSSVAMGAGWAMHKKSCFADIPSSQPISFDPKTGDFDAGGVSIVFNQAAAWLLEQRKTNPRTTLTNDVGTGSTSPWTVGDTTNFPAEGWFWVGSEAVEYVGKSATQLGTSAIGRGALGTQEDDHKATALVYGYNPFLHGRRCVLWSSNLRNTVERKKVFAGYIDETNDSGRALRVISSKKRIIDHVVGAGAFARGILTHEIDKSTGRLVLDITNKEAIFPVYTNQDSYLTVGDELIQYRYRLYPRSRAELSGIPNGYQVESSTLPIRKFEVGDVVDFETSSGLLLDGGEGARLVKVTRGTPDTYDHTSGLDSGDLSVGDWISANYRVELWGLTRGVWNSPIAGAEGKKVEKGAECSEVRVLEGNQLVLLFQMLFSKKGDGTNGPKSGLYDVFPEGWGLGLSASDVDVESFEKAGLRTSFRRYKRIEGLELRQYLAWFALETNCAVFIDESGVLSCRVRGDVYNGGIVDHTLTRSNVVASQLPTQDVKMQSVANFASIRANFDVNGNSNFTEEIRQEESIVFYGIHPLFEVEDTGIISVGGISTLTYHIEAALAFRAHPQMVLHATIRYDADEEWTPGQVVRVTLPHLLDLAGGAGLDNEDFELLEAHREPNNQTTTLLLQQRRPSRGRGRIAPSAIVQSVAGSVLTLKIGAASGFSYDTASQVPMETPSGEEGTEDVDWLVEGLNVQIWDESDMATGTYHSTFIDSIDHTAGTITLNSTPGSWTIASGDIVRLEDWNTVGASLVAALYQFIYLCFANDANPPVLGSSDDPYLVGL